MKQQELGLHTIGVKTVLTSQLHANPHNPRLLFDRAELDILRASIEKVGILVPLTVYLEKKSGHYIILDGQRRWMCAQDAGVKRVPVNEVSEPDLIQNIVTMFQIHKLREDWELMPTALKLEVLMGAMQERRDRNLSELTGLDIAVVARCKKLLSYRKRYRDMMLDVNPSKRVKADFFIELYAVRNDREVQKFDWYSKDRFTDAMLHRFETKRLKAVTDFRVVKQRINNAVKAGKTKTISRRLQQFAENPDLTLEHLDIESAKVAAEAKKLVKSIGTLYAAIDDLDADEFFGEEVLWQQLEALAKLIHSKLRGLGRREAK
jgi:ParB family transcriptional regulator, chromosome partitioning protein